MTKVLNILRAILFLAGTVALVSISYVCYDIHKQLPEVALVLRSVHAAGNETALTMSNVRKVTSEWKNQSDQQSKNITNVTVKVGQNLDAMKTVIEKVGSSADTFNTSLVTLTSQLSTSTGEVSATISDLKPIVINLRDASANLVKVTGDPEVLDTLHNINSISKHTDNVATDLNKAADLAELRFEQAMKPKKLVVSVFERLLGVAAPAAQIISVVK